MSGEALRRIGLNLVFLLPVVAFAGVWASTYRFAQQGQEWLVPIEGFDPRDWLRGHYVQYRYEWPMGAMPQSGALAAPQVDLSYGSELCIVGTAPHISRAYPLNGGVEDKSHPPCAAIIRSASGTRDEVQGLATGILYASQERAIALSQKLADSKLQGYIRVKVRPDGVILPVDMEFTAIQRAN